MHDHARIVASGALALALTSAVFAGPIYDGSTGQLPHQQGWAYTDTGAIPTPLNPDVAARLGPTKTTPLSYWSCALPNGGVGFGDNGGWSFSASVKVEESSWYQTPDFKRAGYYISLSDKTGKWAGLGIASDRIVLATKDVNASDGVYMFDTTQGFNTYELRFSGLSVSALINGQEVLTGTVGTAGYANLAWFGDGSSFGSSKTQTAWVSLSPVPAPGPVALATAAGLLSMARRRR